MEGILSEAWRHWQLFSTITGNKDVYYETFWFCGRVRMPCATYIEKDAQNACYEGYTTIVEVSNLFVFNFKGEVMQSGINFPGHGMISI